MHSLLDIALPVFFNAANRLRDKCRGFLSLSLLHQWVISILSRTVEYQSLIKWRHHEASILFSADIFRSDYVIQTNPPSKELLMPVLRSYLYGDTGEGQNAWIPHIIQFFPPKKHAQGLRFVVSVIVLYLSLLPIPSRIRHMASIH